jgi:hypothetical protein
MLFALIVLGGGAAFGTLALMGVRMRWCVGAVVAGTGTLWALSAALSSPNLEWGGKEIVVWAGVLSVVVGFFWMLAVYLGHALSEPVRRAADRLKK